MASSTHTFEPDSDVPGICGYRPHAKSPECGFPASNRAIHAPGALPGPRLAALPTIRKDHAAIADGAPTTSVTAGAIALPQRGSKRLQIVEMLTHPGARVKGLTCEEVETITGWKHQSASSAYNDLARDGIIRKALDDEGQPITRSTSSGARAQAWVLTEQGYAAFQAERAEVAS